MTSPEGHTSTAGAGHDPSLLLSHHHLTTRHGGQLCLGRSHPWGRRRNAGRTAGSEPGPGIKLGVDRPGVLWGREGPVGLSHVLAAVLLDLGLTAAAHQRVVGRRTVGWRGLVTSGL